MDTPCFSQLNALILANSSCLAESNISRAAALDLPSCAEAKETAMMEVEAKTSVFIRCGSNR